MPSAALTREQIHDLVSRAGIAGAGCGPQGRATEGLVLVFCGRWRHTLDVYDQNGRLLGGAVRAEGRNRQAGYRYHYEFDYQRPDSPVQCALRDVTGGQAGFRPAPYMFSVLGADGVELASIVATGGSVATVWGLPRPSELEIACAGVVAGCFRPAVRRHPEFERSSPSKRLRRHDQPSSQVWYMHDREARDLARITYIRRERPSNAYVVEIDPSVTEPLRTVAPAFCVIADNLLIDRSRSPVGGG